MEISKLITKMDLKKKAKSTFYRELGLAISFVIGVYYLYCVLLPKFLSMQIRLK